jgi:outer membrane protein assembly factor BamB
MAITLLPACSIFKSKEDEELLPLELTNFESSVKIKRLWSTKIGDSSDQLLLGLSPVGDGNLIYAAAPDGIVLAINPETGETRWKVELEVNLSAGPGAGEGFIAVTSKEGDVILLNASTGEEQWRRSVSGEVLARPLIDDNMVIIQTIDNRIIALARVDGRQRWELEQTMPLLSMRGSTSPLIVGPLIITGFDNGRLAGIDMETGDIKWDSMLSMSSGRSDLDRLSDIDGAISLVGQDVYAAGYQGRLSAIAAESGQVLWSREISSYVGVASDWSSVYTIRDDGEIIALRRNNGIEIWRNDKFLRRKLTLPTPFNSTVVVGDFEGYLHFLSIISGKQLARVRFGRGAITSHPLVMGNRLFIQSDNGNIGAFEVVKNNSTQNSTNIPKKLNDSDISSTEDNL